MRKKSGIALAAACALAYATALPAYAESDNSSDSGLVGEYIVVFEDNVDAQSLIQEHVQKLGIDLGSVYRSALQGYSAVMPEAVKNLIADAPGVAYVQPDREVHTTAQATPTGINRAGADESPTADIDGTDQRTNVDVAVIDTGVDLDHPDLNVYEEGAKSCSLLGLSANDNNGHGTHVAGTIGALDNGTGVVGMAPGARIWPVKVLNALGSGTTSDVICGIDYVAAHADRIEVANMSLGGSGADDGNCGNTNGDAQHQAICNAVSKGVTFVVAAGNSSKDAGTFAPAAYDEVITVSALADFNGRPGGGAASTCRADVDDTFADFSNFGSDVDLIAPGTCIRSTWMNGGYDTISGTSMASPHVAGGAALYTANHPNATPQQVKSALQNAGTLDWTWPSEDQDGTQEKLLDVSGF
ncbi:S8 family peptidase [Haloactinomyces albus]|uniref:Subtilisin family serine protease n=1 Tax=Haloactinomyces albus TaxID=1352928 RepID=A0AAE3ZC04_9ACTN|nr:S8 family peptidase [Haloactinomyces albus]MDR7300344.1 subtilisin family serine protease [Haloactinomyces albus]